MEVIGTLATVVALVFAIKSFDKNSRIQEAIFVKDLFENFQRDRQAILDNPTALNILAQERGTTPEEMVKASIGSFAINRAYLIYHLHERKLTPEKRWERDIKDMQVMFSEDLVHMHWKNIRARYPIDFQQFVETRILTKKK